MKTVKHGFLDIMPCYYFSLQAVLQGVANNNSTESSKNYILELLASEYQKWRCSVKNVFLTFSQNSQNITCARVFF